MVMLLSLDPVDQRVVLLIASPRIRRARLQDGSAVGAASWLYSPRPYLWFSTSLLIQSARFQVGSVTGSGAAA
jgi:hypothetical protein